MTAATPIVRAKMGSPTLLSKKKMSGGPNLGFVALQLIMTERRRRGVYRLPREEVGSHSNLGFWSGS